MQNFIQQFVFCFATVDSDDEWNMPLFCSTPQATNPAGNIQQSTLTFNIRKFNISFKISTISVIQDQYR